MSNSNLLTVFAIAAMIAIYLSVSIEVSTDGRPRGDASDIESLASRDDINIVFILVDTLRADRLGAYGYARATSPAIDEMAEDGILFENHRSQSSWTKTSMASLWTGLNPTRTGILRYTDALPDEVMMPAEIIREAGYRTFGIWRNGWVAPNFGFHQGFESYHNPRTSKLPPEVRQENPTLQIRSSDTDIVDSTLALLRSYQNERFFLYLHMMDLHQYTYDEESALFGTSYSDIYDNSIRRTDRLIGTMLDEIVGLGLRDRTLVVLVSDHGEAFGEHGHEGHARDLHAEVTTTPFIISLPFRLDTGIRLREISENVDVWPTLLELLGLPTLSESDGRSKLEAILAVARGQNPELDERARFAQLDQTWGRIGQTPAPLVAVIKDGYRLIERVGSENGTQLFNLESDPQEQDDQVLDEPDVVDSLRSTVQSYLQGSPPPWQPREVEIDDMDLRQLRALGYAID